MLAEKLIAFVVDNLGLFTDFVMKAAVAFVVFYVGQRLILWICRELRASMRRFNTEEAVVSFVYSLVRYGLMALMIVTIVVRLGIVTEATIAAAVASAGVAVSLALQGGLSNFAGGVMILMMRPFKVGDYILFPDENQEGIVKKIEMYYTTLVSIDNRTILIPNANLTNHTIINVTGQNRRKLELKVGISYDSDIALAKSILERLVDEEPAFYPEERMFFVDNLGEGSVVVAMRAWVDTSVYWTVLCQMRERVKAAFDEAGVRIPFPQMDVHLEQKKDRES